MKDIKKSASFTSKQKGKDVKFNIDLNYSPEYDSFIIKVKEGEGFMAYSSNIERMPLEVIQKLNEMLEEVLIKAGSKTEMKEHKMFDGGNFQSGVYAGGGSIKESDIKVGEKFKLMNGEVIEIKRLFTENMDENWVEFTRNGKSHEGSVNSLKIFINNWREGKKKYEFGGNFQSGVYANGGYFDGSIPEVSSYMTNYNRGGAMKNERLHVNKDEDYEVRYSKPRPHRKGYKGLRSFDGGGEMDLTDDKRLRVTKPVMPEKKMSEQEWAEKHNPRAYEYMTKRKMATGGGVGLIGNQSRIDMNKNGKIDAEDFKLLRSSMNGAWRNERKHVNQSDPKQDYEVRYAKPRPKRTGYKGKRNFITGGKMQKAESGTMVKKGVKGGIMTLAKKIRKEGESWQDAVKRAGQQLK